MARVARYEMKLRCRVRPSAASAARLSRLTFVLQGRFSLRGWRARDSSWKRFTDSLSFSHIGLPTHEMNFLSAPVISTSNDWRRRRHVTVVHGCHGLQLRAPHVPPSRRRFMDVARPALIKAQPNLADVQLYEDSDFAGLGVQPATLAALQLALETEFAITFPADEFSTKALRCCERAKKLRLRCANPRHHSLGVAFDLASTKSNFAKLYESEPASAFALQTLAVPLWLPEESKFILQETPNARCVALMRVTVAPHCLLMHCPPDTESSCITHATRGHLCTRKTCWIVCASCVWATPRTIPSRL